VLDVTQDDTSHYISTTTFVASLGVCLGSRGELSNLGVGPSLVLMSSLSIEGTRIYIQLYQSPNICSFISVYVRGRVLAPEPLPEVCC
jgi:hypothetical protein